MDGSDSDSDDGVRKEMGDSDDRDLEGFGADSDDMMIPFEDDDLDHSSLSEVEVMAVTTAQMTATSFRKEYTYTEGLVRELGSKTESYDQVKWLLDRKKEVKSMIRVQQRIMEDDELSLGQRLAALDYDSLKEKMNNFTTSAENLCRRNRIAFKQRQHYFSQSVQGCSSPLRGSNTFEGAEEKEVVGFNEDVATLLGMLHDDGNGGQLEIISIVGAAGGGKTTLAREVYDHPLTSQSFAFRAWVNVSQQYDNTMKRNLLISILELAYPRTNGDYEKSSADELGEDTHKFLKGKKYLIVMDDVWSTEAWNDIQRSFPKEYCGSKVLFTSRLPVQPNNIHCIDPYRLAALSKNSSWELLRKKVFAQNCCPLELEVIGKHIADKCQGLPLAIVTIAGILVMKDKKLNVWEEVLNHLSSINAKNDDGCMGILELSYNHLPLHLKDCFVYIGGFPEDYEIPIRVLIWLWIAEGFISEEDKSLEDVAKDYLCNLINRNLVMVARKRSFEGIKACCIHDLIRELCLEKAMEKKFLLQIFKGDTLRSFASVEHHRLFIGSHLLEDFFYESNNRKLHSLLCLGLQNSSQGVLSEGLSFFARSFRLLRVLYFISAECSGHVGEKRLAHLRYLALQVPRDLRHFELPFSLLFNLETLHLQGRLIDFCKQCILLPCDIFKMTKLRHLYAKLGVFQYHHPHWDYLDENPESGFDRLSKLGSLQTLHQICACEDCRDFLARTPKLRKLGICGVQISRDSYPIVNPDLQFLECLETLSIANCSINYALEFEFPQTLTQLTLKLTRLEWEKLSSLQTLPRLEVLKLLKDACIGKIWNTSELEGFSQLKYLRLEGLLIKKWEATEDQFLNLEVLVVNNCAKLKRIPIDFAQLNELRKIEVRWSGPAVEESAREIQKERINDRGDDGRIEILAEGNLE